jgi:preprotein translocase subunit SecD
MKGTGRLVASIVFVLILVGTAVAGFLTSVRPVLGLDLTGGLSVILRAPEGTDKGVMERALESIRNRVDAVGVAEPDISLVGSNLIQVQVPGAGKQGTVVKQGKEFCAKSAAGKTLRCFKTKAAAQAAAEAQGAQSLLKLIGQTARLEERPVVKVIPPSDQAYKTTELTKPDEHGLLPQNKNVLVYSDSNDDGAFTQGTDPIYQLGPVAITGADLTKAQAVFQTSNGGTSVGQTGWQINFTLNKAGAKTFGDVTTRLAALPANTPQRQLAIVLDRVVQSSPEVQGAITGGQGQITGTFTETEAKDLAIVLNSGALPVQLGQEQVLTVSPTLGSESLQQGLIAGIVGLVLLMLYLAYYYRLLGVVTWFGMSIWAVLAVGLVSLLGRTVGYALTLAGVAGIIVSLGITADSYIVFYERLKDEVRHGKSLRAAVVPAFQRSWKTIVAADIVTMIAAVVLYLLAIGSVRGFALTLGLSTALDMFVVFFFKRPLVFLISKSPMLTSLRGVGLRSGVAADPVPVAGGAK